MPNNMGPGTRRSIPRKPRRLNLSRIKSWIVSVVGVLTAFGSAVTGLGSQIAFAPMLTWMFGFSSDKALATAMRFAFATAVGAVLGSTLGHSIPDRYVLNGIALFIGAVAGALLGAPLSQRLKSMKTRQLGYSIGIAICLWVILRTARMSPFDAVGIAFWRTFPLLALLGLIAGFITQVLGLPSGLLLVPSLYYVGSFTPSEAISLSILVIALASLLPTLSYSRTGRVDTQYRWPVLISAIVGGFLGGRILPPDHLHALYSHRILIIISAVVSMFLCAREIAIVQNSGSGDEKSTQSLPVG